MKTFLISLRRLVVLAAFLACISLASAASPGFLYALSENATTGSQIYGYSVDETTGTLTALPGFPVATGGNGVTAVYCKRLVVDQANARLYAVNRNSSTVSAFSINRGSGAITALPFSPLNHGLGSAPVIAVHPSGSPLLIARGNGTLASFVVSATSATPAAGSPFGFAGEAFTAAFSQNGQFFYTGGDFGNEFVGLSVDPATGVLTTLAGSPYDTGVSFPEAYATDPAGRLFLTNFSSGDVRAYTTAAGIPTEVSASPFVSGLSGAMDGIVHPAGFYIVADRIGNQVGVYQISGSGGSTTLAAVAGSPFPSGGTVTNALALSQSARYLFVGNGTTRNITTFQVSPGTGIMGAVTTQPVDTMGDGDFLLSSLASYSEPTPPPTPIPSPSVDSTPPSLKIRGRKTVETLRKRVVIRGTATDTSGTPELDVKVRGAKVAKSIVRGNGSFKVVLRVQKERGRVIAKLRAIDSVGNRSKQSKFRILRR